MASKFTIFVDTMKISRSEILTSFSPTQPESMREFFSNAWKIFHPQSLYVLLPVMRQRYISDSTVSGLNMFHDVPTCMSCKFLSKLKRQLNEAISICNNGCQYSSYRPVLHGRNSFLQPILWELFRRNCNRSKQAAE